MQNYRKVLPLLPNYFKKIGIGFILLLFLLAGTRKAFLSEMDFFIVHKAIIKTVFDDLLILGLVLYGFAREKLEDERMFQLRLESLAFAFYFGASQVILMPLINPLFGDPLAFESGFHTIFMMLFFYILIFLGKKQFA